jgi:anti-sigma factor RsiW
VTCSWCEERFDPFLEHELEPFERARLVAHLETCDACRSLLEELRVVDALLLQARTIEPEPTFTGKTMAELRALPPPAPATRSSLPAYLVCYIVGAWIAIVAAFVFAPSTMRALGETLVDIARSVTGAFGGIVATFAGVIITVDAILAATVVVSARAAVPWLAQRQRS